MGIKFQIVGYTLGLLITILGLAEMVPALVDLARGHPNANVFFFNGLVCLFFGGAFVIANRAENMEMTVREAFMLTTLSWVFMAGFAAIPLYMADLNIDYADAYFEAMSGFTTTGSTVLAGLDQMSHGVLLWRSMIQWIGGIGIVALGIILLPFLRIGGMQLFQTESSDKSEKALPRSKDVVLGIFMVYCALSFACMLSYRFLGMGWFDAINHSMTTVATAGFSTHDKSFGYYEQPALHYAASLFMFLSSLPFTLFMILMIKGKFQFFQDEQVRALSGVVAAIVLIMTFWLWQKSDYSIEQSFRYSLFNLISVVSTTGYATTDYGAWGSFATVMFLLVTYIGGAAGSSAGGPKTMRLIIAVKIVGRHLKGLVYPNGSFPVYYQGRTVEHDLAMNVLGFLSFYVMVNVILSVAVAMTGADFLTAVSGVATAMANAGNGVGEIIGPAGNFSSLHDNAKWILSLAMLLGRLEILTVAVLFTPAYWRK